MVCRHLTRHQLALFQKLVSIPDGAIGDRLRISLLTEERSYSTLTLVFVNVDRDAVLFSDLNYLVGRRYCQPTEQPLPSTQIAKTTNKGLSEGG
jgi:hypothetical protein